ncbi:MAG: transglutaminase family protein [Syntrophorhabdales bacterium]
MSNTGRYKGGTGLAGRGRPSGEGGSARQFVFALAALLSLLLACPSWSETILLEGRLDTKVRIVKEMAWRVDRPLKELTVSFSLPAQFSNRAVSQRVEDLEVAFDPLPATAADEYDRLGNVKKRVTWNNLNRDARVTMTYHAVVKVRLSAMESSAAFPLRGLPTLDGDYLGPTEFVQSTGTEIASLASRLTHRAATEYEAVTAIMEYVADNVRYAYNPEASDALSTLRTGSGNCTNMAHLSVALLRASGIPARIVGGTSLNKQWRMPIDNYKQIVQAMGQGGHAWVEIYFPDLGWLSYDPRQSKQFTSSRHVKESHGIDHKDIVDSWVGVPYAPAYTDRVDASFVQDDIEVRPKGSRGRPVAYLASNQMSARIDTVVAPGPVPAPVTQRPIPPIALRPHGTLRPPPDDRTIPEEGPPVGADRPGPVRKPAPPRDGYVEFGNTEFPHLVNAYTITGHRGTRILDAETAEYVTSRHVYAQAFTVASEMTVKEVSLAMHKFGGDGTIYIDLVADDEGKPGLDGSRSLPVFLDGLARRPGYDWITFRMPDGAQPVLTKGKYWIVLRRSGEAVLTWFYIPGKSYGGPDDTRSTLKGHRWEDILMYDFVFKVRGVSGGRLRALWQDDEDRSVNHLFAAA